ncbi:MAG: glutathione synthase, partial [Pseudomonadales bacterium]|nr:glutathione synthase [Pseudomonadales bacterium]
MTIKLGIVMDPIDKISYKKDTSLAMLWAAAERGWQISYMEQQDLFQRDGLAMAHMKTLTPKRNPDQWYEFGASYSAPLADLDVILMRKDPPFDMNFIYTTYLLEQAETAGCLIVNKPASLRDCNEKMFATQFPQCCPPTLVGSDAGEIRAFAQT